MSKKKIDDGYHFHYKCCKCGEAVATNLANFNEWKLCKTCGKKRVLIERVLNDEGFMAIMEQVAEEAMNAGKEKPGDNKVDYKCPKCGNEGWFTVLGNAPSQKDKEFLSKLPACPMCMGLKAFKLDDKEPTPGMPKTEGPVGPTPVIKDPDEDQKSLSE